MGTGTTATGTIEVTIGEDHGRGQLIEWTYIGGSADSFSEGYRRGKRDWHVFRGRIWFLLWSGALVSGFVLGWIFHGVW